MRKTKMKTTIVKDILKSKKGFKLFFFIHENEFCKEPEYTNSVKFLTESMILTDGLKFDFHDEKQANLFLKERKKRRPAINLQLKQLEKVGLIKPDEWNHDKRRTIYSIDYEGLAKQMIRFFNKDKRFKEAYVLFELHYNRQKPMSPEGFKIYKSHFMKKFNIRTEKEFYEKFGKNLLTWNTKYIKRSSIKQTIAEYEKHGLYECPFCGKTQRGVVGQVKICDTYEEQIHFDNCLIHPFGYPMPLPKDHPLLKDYASFKKRKHTVKMKRNWDKVHSAKGKYKVTRHMIKPDFFDRQLNIITNGDLPQLTEWLKKFKTRDNLLRIYKEGWHEDNEYTKGRYPFIQFFILTFMYLESVKRRVWKD